MKGLLLTISLLAGIVGISDVALASDLGSDVLSGTRSESPLTLDGSSSTLRSDSPVSSTTTPEPNDLSATSGDTSADSNHISSDDSSEDGESKGKIFRTPKNKRTLDTIWGRNQVIDEREIPGRLAHKVRIEQQQYKDSIEKTTKELGGIVNGTADIFYLPGKRQIPDDAQDLYTFLQNDPTGHTAEKGSFDAAMYNIGVRDKLCVLLWDMLMQGDQSLISLAMGTWDRYRFNNFIYHITPDYKTDSTSLAQVAEEHLLRLFQHGFNFK